MHACAGIESESESMRQGKNEESRIKEIGKSTTAVKMGKRGRTAEIKTRESKGMEWEDKEKGSSTG